MAKWVNTTLAAPPECDTSAQGHGNVIRGYEPPDTTP